MKPTDEQERAIKLFLEGDSLAIEAGAGTGKTSTLIYMAEADRRRRGQYVVFNRALADESQGKFPETVSCNTAHSLAFRAVGRNYADRLRAGGRMPGWQVAQRLGIRSMRIPDFLGQPKDLSAGYLAGLCSKAITRFCQSADLELATKHFPYVEGLDATVAGHRQYTHNDQLREFLLPFAKVIWEDLSRTVGWATFKHEHYLKLWHLSGPRVPVDYILFDESQDANPVIAAIVALQTQAQRVYVGDAQQEIYAWTGAVNALAQVQVANRTYLTQSFRFGQPVADVANEILLALDSPLELRGNPAIESVVGPIETPRAILTRTNAVGVSELFRLQADGVRATLVGGASDVLGFTQAAQELMQGRGTSYPELACFATWPEVQMYVEQDPEGEDLRLLVRLVDQFGPDAIVSGLSRMPRDEKDAEVVISTAHKSKGRQWESVRIAGDFPESEDPATLRLRYVAVTRAQTALDISALPPLGAPKLPLGLEEDPE